MGWGVVVGWGGHKRVRAVGQGGAWGKAGANNQGHLSYPEVKEP